jgi:hypothetical protein
MPLAFRTERFHSARRLRRGEQRSVKGGRPLELLHDFLAFIDHAVDSITGLPLAG